MTVFLYFNLEYIQQCNINRCNKCARQVHVWKQEFICTIPNNVCVFHGIPHTGNLVELLAHAHARAHLRK